MFKRIVSIALACAMLLPAAACGRRSVEKSVHLTNAVLNEITDGEVDLGLAEEAVEEIGDYVEAAEIEYKDMIKGEVVTLAMLSFASQVGVQKTGSSTEQAMCGCYCVAYVRSYLDGYAHSPHDYRDGERTAANWDKGRARSALYSDSASLYADLKNQLDEEMPCILKVQGNNGSFSTHYAVVTAYTGDCTSFGDLTIVDPWDGLSYSGEALTGRFHLHEDKQLVTFPKRLALIPRLVGSIFG